MRRTRVILAGFAGLFAAVCLGGAGLAPAKQAPAKPAPAAETPAKETPASACPSEDFAKFLEAFAEKVEIQRAFTRYPLEELSLDLESDTEPKQVKHSLPREKVDFPIMPGAEERKEEGLQLRTEPVEGKDGKQQRVSLFQDGTDNLTHYVFEKSSCWMLISVDYKSL